MKDREMFTGIFTANYDLAIGDQFVTIGGKNIFLFDTPTPVKVHEVSCQVTPKGTLVPLMIPDRWDVNISISDLEGSDLLANIRGSVDVTGSDPAVTGQSWAKLINVALTNNYPRYDFMANGIVCSGLILRQVTFNLPTTVTTAGELRVRVKFLYTV